MRTQGRCWYRTLTLATLFLSLMFGLIPSDFRSTTAAGAAHDAGRGSALRSATQLFGGVHAVTVAEGVAYAASESGVAALDAATGEVVWLSDGVGGVNSTPQIAGEMIYAGSSDGTVRALDAATGVERWSFDSGAVIYDALAVADGAVYGSNLDGVYFALDATTGVERWSFSTNSDASSTPAVDDGVVYFGSGNTNIYALDAVTGEEVWLFDTNGEVRSTPVLADGVVYLNSWDGILYAIDMASGQELWSFDTGYAIRLMPVVIDNMVYIETFHVAVVALDRATGAVIKSFDIVRGGGSSLVTSDLIVSGNSLGTIAAAERITGTELWSFETAAMVLSAPALHDGVVLVSNRDDVLYAIDAENGEQRWQYAYGHYLISTPAFHDGLVLIGSGDGNVYALAVETGEPAWIASTSESGAVAAPVSQAPNARELLPKPEELVGEWPVEQEGERTDTDVALQFGADGRDLLRRWGWNENVYRDFERQNPEQYQNEATHITVSVHAFDTSEGASAALEPFSEVVVESVGIPELPIDDVGDSARAFSGTGVNLNLAVVFVQQDDFLIRVAVSFKLGDPTDTTIAVVRLILAKLSPDIVVVSSPVAVADAAGYEGLEIYSAQVIAAEEDSVQRIVTEFGVDGEHNFFLLEPYAYPRLATLHDARANALDEIESPDFAQAWHEVQVERQRHWAMILRSGVETGELFSVALHHWDESRHLFEREDQAYLHAMATCPAFETFWLAFDLVDGHSGQPPGESVTYAACSGLNQYGSNLARARLQTLTEQPTNAAEIYSFISGRGEALRDRSPDELIVLAEFFEGWSEATAEVTPPAYAEAWHALRVIELDRRASMLRVAASDGWGAADAFYSEGEEARGREYLGALGIAMDACSVFWEFVEAYG